MEKINSIDELSKAIKKGIPTKRPEYLAMILDFSHYDYTIDKIESITPRKAEMEKAEALFQYLKAYRILQKNNMSKNIYLLHLKELCKEKKYDELLEYAEKNKEELNKLNIEGSGIWNYFRGFLLDPTKDDFHSNNVNYRLYLNVDLAYRAQVAKSLIDTFSNQKIPYYFKATYRKENTDTLVFYIDSKENLLRTVNAIIETYENNPNFLNHTKKTAAHLFDINGIIGYGFNDKTNTYSYTEIMKKCDVVDTDRKKALREAIINRYLGGKEVFYKRGQLENEKLFMEKFNDIYQTFKDEIDDILMIINNEMHKYYKNVNSSKPMKR